MSWVQRHDNIENDTKTSLDNIENDDNHDEMAKSFCKIKTTEVT